MSILLKDVHGFIFEFGDVIDFTSEYLNINTACVEKITETNYSFILNVSWKHEGLDIEVFKSREVAEAFCDAYKYRTLKSHVKQFISTIPYFD